MTTVPATIDAILRRLGERPGLARARIIDGPWLRRPSEPDVIVVGWLPDEGPTVEFTSDIAGLGSTRESYDVVLLVSSWRGGTSMREVRTRSDELVDELVAALVEDPTLGGAVTRARLSGLSMSQYQAEDGAQCAHEVTVRVDAFRTL